MPYFYKIFKQVISHVICKSLEVDELPKKIGDESDSLFLSKHRGSTLPAWYGLLEKITTYDTWDDPPWGNWGAGLKGQDGNQRLKGWVEKLKNHQDPSKSWIINIISKMDDLRKVFFRSWQQNKTETIRGLLNLS